MAPLSGLRENLVLFGRCREIVGEVFRVLALLIWVRDELRVLTVIWPWDEWPLLDAAAVCVGKYPFSSARRSELSAGLTTPGGDEMMAVCPTDEERISCSTVDWISGFGSSSMILERPLPGGTSTAVMLRLIPAICGWSYTCSSSSLILWRLIVNQARASMPATTTQTPIMRAARAPGFRSLVGVDTISNWD